MTDLRLYQQGQELPLILHTGAWPDATPTATLATAAGVTKVRVPLPADDQAEGPGLFRLGWPLDGRTPPGDYLIVYRWLDSGAARLRVQRVRVIPAGPDGGADADRHGPPDPRPQPQGVTMRASDVDRMERAALKRFGLRRRGKGAAHCGFFMFREVRPTAFDEHGNVTEWADETPWRPGMNAITTEGFNYLHNVGLGGPRR